MGLADDYAASLDPRIAAQVTAAIYGQVQNIYTEEGTVQGHAARAAFAGKVVSGGVSLQPLILHVCSFASLTAATPDATVSNAVAALWSTWAGA